MARTRALTLLRDVVAGRDTSLFVTRQNNPWREVPPSVAGSELVDQAEAIVDLAQRHGEDLSQLAAPRLLRTFQSANDLGNPHRLGPIRLAALLADELTEKSG
jgi:hypothetical protein